MSNKRMAVNTAATYSRTVFAAGLALFSSRWLLNSLGSTDYGLFSVMASLIIVVTFLNGVLATSVTRQFAFSLGQGDSKEVNHWFNSSLGLHLGVALLLVVVGWPIGEYVISHYLTVPEARLDASLWVFRISLISAFASMVSVPFVAMFIAKQHIFELALWGIAQSALTFLLAASLHRVAGDRLIFYASGMVAILVLISTAQILRGLKIFEECGVTVRHWFDRTKCRGLFSFAAWNVIGSGGVLFREQGSAILLNLFFGPTVNAAYGLATQVSTQANQLSTAMVGALAPEVTASEGRGDRARVLALSQRTTKFSTILVLLLAVPLMVEMDYLLKIWLGVPPPYTAVFCQLILITFLLDRLSSGYILAVYAHGKIAGYQTTVGLALLLTLPLAWLLLVVGFGPTSVAAAILVTAALSTVVRAWWGRRLFGMPIRHWVTSIVAPVAMVTILTMIAAVIPSYLLAPSLSRFALTGISSVLTCLLSAWFVFLDDRERAFIGESFRRLYAKN